jgi:hypothetical protein
MSLPRAVAAACKLLKDMSKVGSIARSIIGESGWSWLRERRFGPHTVVNKYGGQELRIHIADWIGREWYSKGIRELEEIRLLSQYRLRRGACVFDIGAHQCVVALMLAGIVGETGRVVAVEADYHNARVGRVNARLNNASTIDVIYAAAAAKEGHLKIGSVQKVKAVTVDSLARDYGVPDVLYIDVDGAEVEVLKGAVETIEKHRPDLFVEVHVGAGLEAAGGSIEAVLQHLPEHAYELLVFCDDKESRPVPYHPDLALLKERFFLLAISRSYIGNGP